MISETRIYPYHRSLLVAGIADLMEQLRGDFLKDEETSAFLCSFQFYNTQNVLSVFFMRENRGTVAEIRLVEPAPGLTEEGQRRVIHFFLDSIEQLIENELAKTRMEEQT